MSAQASERILITGEPADIAAFGRLVEQARGEQLYRARRDVEALRAGYRAFGSSPLARRPPPDVAITPMDVDGVPGWWLRPPGASDHRSFLYLHGGGYICGSALDTAGVAASFSVALGCPVLAIDYRLAPEQPFPAAFDDVLVACNWLAARQSGPLLIGGDSAGGGLAVAAAAALTAKTPSSIGGVITASGVLDLTMSASTWRNTAGEDLISPSLAPFLYDMYLNGSNPRDPRASPVFADLRQLPPTLIVVGGAEYLLGDSEMLANAARACGRNVQLEVYAGMPHNFIKFANPVADLAFRRIGEWAQRRFAEFDR